MDWRQVWNKDLETHRQKLPWSPADQNNINVNEENKLCQIMTKKNKHIVLWSEGYPRSTRRLLSGLCSIEWKYVYYVMIGMIGFNKYLSVRRIQGWSEDLDTHRPKLPAVLQNRSMSNINEENKIKININDENKTSYVVIGGHQARLMQSVLQLRRMIVCCELYDWFLQIPFGAGVEHSFYLFMLLRLCSWYWNSLVLSHPDDEGPAPFARTFVADQGVQKQNSLKCFY
jgi:hypothetical protein